MELLPLQLETIVMEGLFPNKYCPGLSCAGIPRSRQLLLLEGTCPAAARVEHALSKSQAPEFSTVS